VEPASAIIYQPDAEHPGWHVWDVADQTRFNTVVIGRLIVRQEDERGVRLRMLEVDRRHSNLQGNLHGGVTMSLIDIALFATIHIAAGGDALTTVTLDLHNQFIGSGVIGEPLDVVCEVVRETGRLVFLRGTVEQSHGLVAAFMGTLRKPTRK
jgi:uncharacterized protein (TIGR00369 family)